MIKRAQALSGGQGTIEYLVILAIVVVISLVVVGLFVTLMDSPSKEITDSSSQAGSVAVGGISVVEAVIDYDGESLIRLNNNSSDAITLTRITVGGEDNNFSEQLVGLDSKVFSLSSLNSNCPCVSGQKSVKCEIKIIYTTQSGTTQIDYRTINAQCVNDSIPVNANNVVEPIVFGTLAHPFEINNCQELQNINQVLDGNYILASDINCLETTTWNIYWTSPDPPYYSSYYGFLPIGNFESPFTGSLDGRGNTIDGIYINKKEDFTYLGLFGYSTGNISNVGVTGMNYWLNGVCQGGLVGLQDGGSILNSYVTGNFTPYDIYIDLSLIGGLVGCLNESVLSSSYSNVEMIVGTSMQNDNLGGLVGQQFGGLISTSYSLSNISYVGDEASGVGGLVGSSSGVIQNSFSIGAVVNGAWGNGGLVGINTGSISNSYWGPILSGQSNCYDGGDVGCSEENEITQYYGALGKAKLNNDGNWVAVDNNFPKLYWQD